MLQRLINILMEEAGDKGAGGAGKVDLFDGGTPPPKDGTPPPPAVQIPDNWKDALPAELKGLPALEKYKGVSDLVKAYAHMEKMIGADKIVVPQKGTKIADMKDVFNKIGLPMKPEEYEVDLAPDVKKETDENFMKAFKKVAFDLSILPEQAKGLVEWFSKSSAEAFKTQTKQVVDALNERMDKLKSEWGKAFPENVAKAKAAVHEFFDEDDKKYFKSIGMNENPTFIKAMAKVGALLSEDKIKGSGDTGSGALTPSQALEKLKEIRSNIRHPYYDGAHVDHISAKKEVRALYEMAYPTKKTNNEE
jgi:hypothetical protein